MRSSWRGHNRQQSPQAPQAQHAAWVDVHTSSARAPRPPRSPKHGPVCTAQRGLPKAPQASGRAAVVLGAPRPRQGKADSHMGTHERTRGSSSGSAGGIAAWGEASDVCHWDVVEIHTPLVWSCSWMPAANPIGAVDLLWRCGIERLWRSSRRKLNWLSASARGGSPLSIPRASCRSSSARDGIFATLRRPCSTQQRGPTRS